MDAMGDKLEHLQQYIKILPKIGFLTFAKYIGRHKKATTPTSGEATLSHWGRLTPTVSSGLLVRSKFSPA
jgi:hypothetical protein